MATSGIEYHPAYLGRGTFGHKRRDIVAASSEGNWAQLCVSNTDTRPFNLFMVGDDGSLVSISAKARNDVPTAATNPWTTPPQRMTVEYRADPMSEKPTWCQELAGEQAAGLWRQCTNPSIANRTIAPKIVFWNIENRTPPPERSRLAKAVARRNAYSQIRRGTRLHEGRDAYRARRKALTQGLRRYFVGSPIAIAASTALAAVIGPNTWTSERLMTTVSNATSAELDTMAALGIIAVAGAATALSGLGKIAGAATPWKLALQENRHGQAPMLRRRSKSQRTG